MIAVIMISSLLSAIWYKGGAARKWEMAEGEGKNNYEQFLESYIKGEEVKLTNGKRGEVEKNYEGVANPLQLYRPQGPYASGAGKRTFLNC